ncbi:MAG: hypothetical protein KGM17_07930 [Sphingomonadales bacterium]|nr:hypothetical protein [Sphingomonadales bacterium]
MVQDGRSSTDRRSLIKGAAALGALATTPFGVPEAFARQAPDWVWNPMRWVQINFTEDDPGRFDPQFWLDFIRHSDTQGVCLSAGGIVAFYPTKVPFHARSPFLGNRDTFGDMAKACKAMGLRVLARVDPSVLRADAIAAHPDWVARTIDGQPRKHPADPSLYLSCPNGPVSFEWLPQVIREIAGAYPVDGIFGNRWSGGLVRVCYCDLCKSEFRAFSGLEVPGNLLNRQDPAVLAYQRWDDEKRFAQIKTYNDTVRSINPEGLFAPGSSWQRLDPRRLRENFRTIYADQQARSPRHPIWAAGRGAKEAACILRDGPIAGSFNVAQPEFKDSVQSIDETLAFMHDGMAQGFRPWLIKFKAELFDKRWVEPVRRAFAWHARHERYFRNTANLATVAMMQSLQTNSTYRGTGSPSMEPISAMTAGGNEAALNGCYQALTEARVPFVLLDDRDLDPAALQRYKVIMLPNIAAMSDSQCATLRDYVAAGGAIVATGETSLYDQTGADRKNFGLADLFGCDFAGRIDRKVDNSYIAIAGPHTLTRGLDDTTRIAGGSRLVQVAPHPGTPRAPLRLIRSYPELPAEMVYPREPVSDQPMVFAHSFGKGRVVYFPFNLDQVYWEDAARDHLLLMRNAVAWAAGEDQPLTVEGAGFVDVSYWRQEKSLAAHLVNLNNPSAMKGFLHETVPLGPFRVGLALPAGTRATRVRLLEAGQEARFRRDGNRLIVEVPRLDLHEVVAVDLA